MGRKANTARVNARRDEIFRKAIETFREIGYNNTTIEGIAAKLNVTKASIYYYVEGKQDLLFEAHRFATDVLLTGLRDIAARQLPPKFKLEQAIRHHIMSVIDELSLTTELLQQEYALSETQREKIIAMRDEYDRLFRGIILEGMASGAFRQGNAKMASFVILGAINWMPHWFSHRGPLNKEELAGLVSDYLLGGLLSQESPSRVATGAVPDVFSITGRLIVVTGAASAPGRSVAWMLVKNGARVVLVDRDTEALNELTTALRANGYSSTSIVSDLAQEAEVIAMFEAATAQFGSIDGLVYTRSVPGAETPLVNVPEAEWRQLVETNLTSAFLVSRAVSRVMSANRNGSIVLLSTSPVSSTGVSSGMSTALRAITTSDTLTRALSLEMAPCRVRVNAVIGGIPPASSLRSAGYDEPHAALQFPEVDAGTMLFLLSPASYYVTGQTLRIENDVPPTPPPRPGSSD